MGLMESKCQSWARAQGQEHFSYQPLGSPGRFGGLGSQFSLNFFSLHTRKSWEELFRDCLPTPLLLIFGAGTNNNSNNSKAHQSCLKKNKKTSLPRENRAWWPCDRSAAVGLQQGWRQRWPTLSEAILTTVERRPPSRFPCSKPVKDVLNY